MYLDVARKSVLTSIGFVRPDRKATTSEDEQWSKGQTRWFLMESDPARRQYVNLVLVVTK